MGTKAKTKDFEVIVIEDDENDIIDLDELETTEIIYEWNAKVQRKFKTCVAIDNEYVLGEVMKEYLESAEPMVNTYEDQEMLKNHMAKHIELFYFAFNEIPCCTADVYLCYMEKILTLYCNLELAYFHSLKRKNWPQKRYQKRIKVMLKRIIHALTVFLLERRDLMLHVLIKMNTRKIANSFPKILNTLYTYFLLKVRESNLSDESFCRNYILFQKWKEVLSPKEQKEIDILMYRKFRKTPDSIKKNESLKQILMPVCQTEADIVMSLFCSYHAISNAYFKHIATKSSTDIDEFDSNVDLAEEEEEQPIFIDDDDIDEVELMKTFTQVEQSMLSLDQKQTESEFRIELLPECKKEPEEDDDVEIVDITIEPKLSLADFLVPKEPAHQEESANVCNVVETLVAPLREPSPVPCINTATINSSESWLIESEVVEESPRVVNQEESSNTVVDEEPLKVSVEEEPLQAEKEPPKISIDKEPAKISIEKERVKISVEEKFSNVEDEVTSDVVVEVEVSSDVVGEELSNVVFEAELEPESISETVVGDNATVTVTSDTKVTFNKEDAIVETCTTVEKKSVEVQVDGPNSYCNDYGITTPPFDQDQSQKTNVSDIYTNIAQQQDNDASAMSTRTIDVQVDFTSYDDCGLTPPNETYQDDAVPCITDKSFDQSEKAAAVVEAPSDHLDTGQTIVNGNTILKNQRTNGHSFDTKLKVLYSSAEDDFTRFERAHWSKHQKENHDFDDVLSGPVSKVVPNVLSPQDQLELFGGDRSRSNSPSPEFESMDDFRPYYGDNVKSQVPSEAAKPMASILKNSPTERKKNRVRFKETVSEEIFKKDYHHCNGDSVKRENLSSPKPLMPPPPKTLMPPPPKTLTPLRSVSKSSPARRNNHKISSDAVLVPKSVSRDPKIQKLPDVVVERMKHLEDEVKRKSAMLRIDFDKSSKGINDRDVIRYLSPPQITVVLSNQLPPGNVDNSNDLNIHIPDQNSRLLSPVPDPENEFSNSPTFLPEDELKHCLEEVEISENVSSICENLNSFTSSNLPINNDNNKSLDNDCLQLPTAVPESYDFEKNLKNEVFSKIDLQLFDDSEVETRLPLKKRKLSVTNSNETTVEDKKEEISYPATPMISIAEVEALHPIKLQQNNNSRFKTPAERKEMPPLPVFYNNDNDSSPVITDQFNINNHTYNNPTFNYHMNNVPVPFINIPCGSYYSLPPILVPFNNFSSFEQSKGNQQATYVKKEPKKQGRSRRRH